ncbi:hypothetical protein SAMN05444000_111123 [Shimia gijangensis]|uniref:Uncharacterized protein n=1 Tax=Shimia gijangensis TaxID=1470563 RepID=A0A1M6L9R2_9RHOB|nr:hypothetical protein [Shimia gijangensis]SHJ67904.1 hypothetical protein SAMN05444000_111123 [Shimia gijangensis]
MFTVLAVLILLGPILATAVTALSGAILIRKKSLLGTLLLCLPVLMGVLVLWELRYDLGLSLPEISWFPTGASAELAMMIVAALSLIVLIVAVVKWPQGLRFRAVPAISAALWAAIIFAGWALSQADFSH